VGNERWLQWNSQNVDAIDDDRMPWSKKLELLLLVLDDEKWEAEKKERARTEEEDDWGWVIDNDDLEHVLELLDVIREANDDEEEGGFLDDYY